MLFKRSLSYWLAWWPRPPRPGLLGLVPDYAKGADFTKPREEWTATEWKVYALHLEIESKALSEEVRIAYAVVLNLLEEPRNKRNRKTPEPRGLLGLAWPIKSKRGRPRKRTEDNDRWLVEFIDFIKAEQGITRDIDAIIYCLMEFGKKSKYRAMSESKKWQPILSKARKKIRT